MILFSKRHRFALVLLAIVSVTMLPGCNPSASSIRTVAEISENIAIASKKPAVDTSSEVWKALTAHGELWSVDWRASVNSGIAHVRLANGRDAFYLITKIPEIQSRLILEGDRMRNPIWLTTSSEGKLLEFLFEKMEAKDEEFTIFRHSLKTGQSKALTRGHGALISPDARRIVFLRSSYTGKHQIFVAKLNEKVEADCILKITEGDPGSGRSFDYYWSSNSNYVLVAGEAREANVQNAIRNGKINLVYGVRGKKYYSVESAIQTSAR